MKSLSRTLRELHVDCCLLTSMGHCSQLTICISSSPTTVRRITCASCSGRKSSRRPPSYDTGLTRELAASRQAQRKIVLVRRGETYSVEADPQTLRIPQLAMLPDSSVITNIIGMGWYKM